MGGLIFIVLLRFRLVRLLTLPDDLNFLPRKSRITHRLSSSVESSQAESKVSPASTFVEPVASSSSMDCNFLGEKWWLCKRGLLLPLVWHALDSRCRVNNRLFRSFLLSSCDWISSQSLTLSHKDWDLPDLSIPTKWIPLTTTDHFLPPSAQPMVGTSNHKQHSQQQTQGKQSSSNNVGGNLAHCA